MAAILVIEDDEQVRVLAESILQEAGYKTLTAGTVAESLALLDSDESINLLFVDIALEGDSHGGLDLAKQAVAARPTLAVIYTTGRGVTDGMRALFVDRFSFVSKPYSAADLLAAVKNALQVRQLRAPK